MAMSRSIPNSIRPSIIRRWAAGHSAQSILDWINETNRRRTEPVQTSLSSVERVIAELQRGDHRACDLATVRRLRLDAQECRDNLADLHLQYMDHAVNAGVVTKTQTREELALRIRMFDRAERIACRRIRMSGLAGAGATRFLEDNRQYVRDQEEGLRREDAAEEYEAAKEARVKATAGVEPAVEPPPAPVAAPEPEAPRDEKSLRLEGAKAPVSKAIEAKECQVELGWDAGRDDEQEEAELRRMDRVVLSLIKKLRPGENWEDVAKEIVIAELGPLESGLASSAGA